MSVPVGEEEGEPLVGEPSLLISVLEMVFLAACLALSWLTNPDTRSSRLPLRLGLARSSRGVTDDPRAGDSRVEEVGEDTELL